MLLTVINNLLQSQTGNLCSLTSSPDQYCTSNVNNVQFQHDIFIMWVAEVSVVLAFSYSVAWLLCRIWRLCVGIWWGLSSNGWAVLGSAQLSQRIHLMSQDWIHLLCLSICFHHKDTSLQFWARLFSFLTSSEKRNSIEHNLIPSAPALGACSCFDHRCKVELCLCPAQRRKKAAAQRRWNIFI